MKKSTKACYKASISQVVCYWHPNRQANQWGRINKAPKDPQVLTQTECVTEGASLITGAKIGKVWQLLEKRQVLYLNHMQEYTLWNWESECKHLKHIIQV